MKNRSLVSIEDYSKEEYMKILALAEKFEANPVQNILNGKVVATLFFEPSTRTRLSFESAVNKLGGRVIGFSDTSSTSVSKGESLKDTIKTVANYSDLIVMRHPIEGSSRYASEVSRVPIINAGDGANQHPTQTLLDLYSINKTQGKLDNLHIFLIGDLKYGRTVHSLIISLVDFNPTFYFISPKELMIPGEYKLMLDRKGIKYSEHLDFTDIVEKADIIYMTRIQKERFSDPMEYEKTKNSYVLKNNMLANAKSNLKILHPLPRVNEINTDVDDTEQAYYFTQALNGVYVRQAIMTSIFGLL
ncbi:MAG: aspartate carbamoyltransferase [Bacteroidetes bacterium RIFOXYA12_FULL_35_11]|nr:MAG: aspartate carbamoyltransferase [Bacteroidetes bacterium GWF2_35_48]OFY74749.1 MAG: aspartate carbamoyltransferase [Bacteroidetes bacterium RIFOXYA12_FULL_35_11]OFY92846.1 MAG: aspartate carbamoyltransferase [Bacteroidetes bacterium RIFOXYB2_FULL_35_7]OFY98926.1 MAG: aspartate carbamoyltransferase [Bacteroidetes bacterium RIFOXYC12_FULL_35_7]HBX52489.1 aspartate carbamoyltransferase [Bacteroidales bacterium]